MEFSLLEIWEHMGVPAMAVALTLVLMGLATITVFVERLLTLGRSRRASKAFAADCGADIDSGRFDHVIGRAEEFKQSHLARVVRNGLSTFRHAEKTSDVSGLTPVERTQRHLERYMEEVGGDLRRGLSVLASVGSVAPFVGLLGTVLGIITAFQGIASSGSGGISSVSAGISEALVETALGLAVAIPAVLAFNYLSGKISAEERTLNHAAGQLLDTIEDHAERAALANTAAATAPRRGNSRDRAEGAVGLVANEALA
jgi:biopolymer transport protein ExbB